MPKDHGWNEACTLEEYILSLIKKKETDSPEFQTMLKIYGRQRFEKIWREYVARGKSNEFTHSGISGDAGKNKESTPKTQGVPEILLPTKKNFR